jgi:glycosyltransferase involved in cell wall biosynthesis
MEDRLRYLWLKTADALIPRITQLNVVISKFLEQLLCSLAPRTPILIVPPLVDTDLFQNDPTKQKAFKSSWQLNERPIVSYLGGYWNVDGVGVLLRAASKLAAMGEQFQLVISGAALEGRDCDDVPRLTEDLGLHNRTTLTGWLPTDQVIAAMSAAEILVVPKLDHIANVAGVPTKLAEYLAVGRAVVASHVGDIPLYVSDNEDALLCNPGDVESLTMALQRVLRDSALRDHLAYNARRTAIKEGAHQKLRWKLRGSITIE